MSDVVAVEQRGATRVVRLNRPEARNALSPELIAALPRWACAPRRS